MRRWLVIGMLLAALAVAGCGEDEEAQGAAAEAISTQEAVVDGGSGEEGLPPLKTADRTRTPDPTASPASTAAPTSTPRATVTAAPTSPPTATPTPTPSEGGGED